MVDRIVFLPTTPTHSSLATNYSIASATNSQQYFSPSPEVYTNSIGRIATLAQYIHSMLRADRVLTSNSSQLPRGIFAMRRTVGIRISLERIERPSIGIGRMTGYQQQRQDSEKAEPYGCWYDGSHAWPIFLGGLLMRDAWL